MANALYTTGREGIGDDSINMLGQTIKAMLVSAGYTPNTAAAGHKFVSDVGSGNIVARSNALANKSFAGGTFDADDAVINAVAGAQVVYVIVYMDTGTDASSRLVVLIDTATGLPYTPNGSAVTLTWDNGANKIFTL